MGGRLLTMLLIAVILYLLLPVTGSLFLAEQAFTPDNLIKLEATFD